MQLVLMSDFDIIQSLVQKRKENMLKKVLQHVFFSLYMKTPGLSGGSIKLLAINLGN